VRRDDALRIVAEHIDELRAEFGVSHLLLFGSVARDEALDGSDVDVLVEFEPGLPYGYFHIFSLQDRLAEILGVRVDLVTVNGLRSEIRDEVLQEAIRAA
jgi:predicted nucleotidyltransferase